MKALIATDLHIHAHKGRTDRMQHCLDVLDWIFKTAEERDCKAIFFLGDLFHDRSKIDVLIYLRTFELFMRQMIEHPKQFDVHLLVGNHDMYHKERWDVNSVKPLTAIPGVHLVDKPTQMILNGRKIDWMPHTDNPVRDLKKLKDDNGGAGDILFGHMAVDGAILNMNYGTRSDVIVEYDNDMVPVNLGVFEDWKHTFLGHYHAAQMIGPKVEYVGSPLQLTYGEAFQDKHVIVLDLDTLEREYIVNDFSPRHYIVTSKEVLEGTYDFNHNFVRVSLDTESEKDIADLKYKMNTDYNVLSFDTKPKDRKVEDDQTVIQDVQSILNNIVDAIETYVKERGVPDGLDKKKLIEKGKLCLEKKISS